MANPNAPRGFSFFKVGSGRELSVTERPVLGSRSFPLFIGDAYTLDSDGNASRAANSDEVKGIVIGIKVAPIPSIPTGPVSQDYIAAADTGTIIGCEDSTAEFLIQATTVSGPAVVGDGCDLSNAVAGSVLRRASGQQIDGTTFGTGVQFRVTGIPRIVGQEYTGAYTKISVKMLQTI